ncbi:baculoviral IAP repeat-containing protein 2-like [Pecten maximus]|uniref:baculoviral IAP repeat-containing protein 2-like n=1 Tax=Pecten maximus TaxID=6579 RepID=UPI00145873F4|nr:baculoviral IAP repeat-containing protein 2-like [Pecten maximus]
MKVSLLYILVTTILVEYGRIMTKTINDEEGTDDIHRVSKIHLSVKHDMMITASKLHSMLRDALETISLKKFSKNLFSERLVRPEMLLNVYPVFGPGVGPAIDLFLSSATPPSRQELMSNESLRLCTFHNYPAAHIVSCLLMAKVGLYYSGHNDEVTCYSCEKSISGWSLGADPYKVHKEQSPNCDHLRGMESEMMSVTSGSSATAPGASNGDVANQATATKSATATNETSIGSKSDTGYSTGSATNDFVETAGSKFGGSTAGPVSTADNTKPQTAISDNSIKSSGSEDRNNVSSSIGNNNSLSSHSENNSQDSLTRSGTNSRISQDTGTHANNIPRQPVSSPTAIHTAVSSNPGTAIPNRSRAFYPDYVLLADRLKTFDRWPADIQQTPDQMLDSGFFYAGYEDCVRCFQCGIGLRNWEPPDNPHVEHARWSPRCAFLLQVKGPDFINLVLDAVAQLERRNNNPEAAESAEPTTQTSNNNIVTTTTGTLKQQSSNNSGQNNASPDITPSGAPPASNATSTTSSSGTSSVAPKSTATTPSTGSSKSGSSSPQKKSMNEVKNKSTKDNITVKNVKGSETVTGSDNKTEGLPNLMETEVVKKLLKDGYDRDSIRAALQILLARKDPEKINEDQIRNIIKQNTTVRTKQPGLFGGGDGTENVPKEELQRIKTENREMRERTVCKICLEDQVSIAFIPCGHLVACSHCAPALTKCAVCRKHITNKIHTVMSV